MIGLEIPDLPAVDRPRYILSRQATFCTKDSSREAEFFPQCPNLLLGHAARSTRRGIQRVILRLLAFDRGFLLWPTRPFCHAFWYLRL